MTTLDSQKNRMKYNTQQEGNQILTVGSKSNCKKNESRSNLSFDRGFDHHGMFVLLKIMYPNADTVYHVFDYHWDRPLDPEFHISVGRAMRGSSI